MSGVKYSSNTNVTGLLRNQTIQVDRIPRGNYGVEFIARIC